MSKLMIKGGRTQLALALIELCESIDNSFGEYVPPEINQARAKARRLVKRPPSKLH